MITEAMRAAGKQAVIAAKAVLKPGDVVQRTRCRGGNSRFIFTHWEGDWVCGKTVSDCHPLSINKLNGQPISFAPPEGEAAA